MLVEERAGGKALFFGMSDGEAPLSYLARIILTYDNLYAYFSCTGHIGVT